MRSRYLDATQIEGMSLEFLAAGTHRIANACRARRTDPRGPFLKRAPGDVFLDAGPEAFPSKLVDRGLPRPRRARTAARGAISRGSGNRLSPRKLAVERVALPQSFRTDMLRGPLTEDFVRERLEEGSRPRKEPFQAHPYAAFEVWNLIDGEKERVLDREQQAELGAVGNGDVVPFLEMLEKSGLVRRMDHAEP